MRSSLRMGGSSSTTRILTGAALMRQPFRCSAGFGTGRLMVNTAPVRSVRFAAAIVPPHGLDEAARDGEAEPRAGAHLIALLHPVELVEDALQVVRRNAVALVQHLQPHRCPRRASTGCGSSSAGGAYLAALSSRLNSTCSNSTASTITIGRSGRDLDLHAVPGQDLARRAPARCRRSRPHRAAPRSAPRRPTRAWSCRAGWR